MLPSKYKATPTQPVRLAPCRVASRSPLVLCSHPVPSRYLSIHFPRRKYPRSTQDAWGYRQARAGARCSQLEHPYPDRTMLMFGHLSCSAQWQRCSRCTDRAAAAGEAFRPVAARLGRQEPRVHPVEALPGCRPANDRCAAWACILLSASSLLRALVRRSKTRLQDMTSLVQPDTFRCSRHRRWRQLCILAAGRSHMVVADSVCRSRSSHAAFAQACSSSRCSCWSSPCTTRRAA